MLDLASDRLVGVAAIAAFRGETERRTYEAIIRGTIPVYKELGRWCASRAALERLHAERSGLRRPVGDDAAIEPEDYLSEVPDRIPAGRVAVHNHVRPAAQLGRNGFRAWTADPADSRIERCRCGWAPHLGRHYRVRREPASPAKFTGRKARAAQAVGEVAP